MPSSLGLRADEGEEVGIDAVLVRRTQAVRRALVDLQLCLPDQLRCEQRGRSDRNDLVVVAVDDARRNVDLLQVIGEVGLREGLDAVEGGLKANAGRLTRK